MICSACRQVEFPSDEAHRLSRENEAVESLYVVEELDRYPFGRLC